MQSITLSTKQMEELHQRLRQLPDCRKPLGLRHPFATALTLSLRGARRRPGLHRHRRVGGTRLTQPQLRRLRARFNPKTQRFEAPSEPTVRRVLQAADAHAVDQVFGAWIMRLTPAAEPIAVDGKTLCGARRENGTRVHLLSTLLQETGTSVAQPEVPQKTNGSQACVGVEHLAQNLRHPRSLRSGGGNGYGHLRTMSRPCTVHPPSFREQGLGSVLESPARAR